MVTIKEIAKECNVSVATVSNILNGRPKVGAETKERVMEAIRRSGYQPNYVARGLRKMKTNMIGIIAEDINQFSTPAIMEGIMEYCEEKKYRTMIQNLRLYARWGDRWYENESAYRSVMEPVMREMLSIKVDGLLYVAGHARVIRFFETATQIPAVVAYAYTRSPHTPVVVIDDEKGAYDMTKYLLAMGHRKIGVLAGREDNIHTRNRLRGHQRALSEEKIPYEPGRVFYGDWEKTSGYRLADSLLREGVTAVFCMNDKMAGGLYAYFREHGIRVGEDISVTGFDNQELTEYCDPELTTMQIDLPGIGAKAADILLEILESEAEQKPKDIFEFSVPCQLIERKSVRRITP
ncbi:MAG: LacI family transcriptional regulator [Lachnospiraceae bacterium]|nr:LacI family transcriptional regulator [Lachnospiraceae bacterium]